LPPRSLHVVVYFCLFPHFVSLYFCAVLKKVKHRLVENMSSGTADALGLSRAILCNDGLVKRLEELEKTAELYRGMMEHTKRLLRAFFELSQTHRGNV
ncbi:hypothetical protein FKM82_028221, partial [Ascaphus truei]